MLIHDLSHITVTTQDIVGGRKASATATAGAVAIGNTLTVTYTLTGVVVAAGSVSGGSKR